MTSAQPTTDKGSEVTLSVRKGEERGRADFGWLDSRHTFSFGHYYDAAHMGFGPLRVINDDRVMPAKGFATHGHQDMEILTYVLEGALEHKDSLGNGSIIRPGDLQRMTAGTGVRHSEYNASATEPVHFLQIWILPQARGLNPGYEQKSFADPLFRDRWQLVASRAGRDGSVTVHQDADIWVAKVSGGAQLEYQCEPGRQCWLQVARGAVTVNEVSLTAGDGLAIPQAARLSVVGVTDAELLLFDLSE